MSGRNARLARLRGACLECGEVAEAEPALARFPARARRGAAQEVEEDGAVLQRAETLLHPLSALRRPPRRLPEHRFADLGGVTRAFGGLAGAMAELRVEVVPARPRQPLGSLPVRLLHEAADVPGLARLPREPRVPVPVVERADQLGVSRTRH